MPYSSPWYLFFLLCVLGAYAAVSAKRKWAVLLAASYFFYVLSSRYLLVFLVLSTVTVYLTGIGLNRIQDAFEAAKKDAPKETRKLLKHSATKKKRLLVSITVLLNLGLLVFLKYYNFFIEQGNSLFALCGLSFELPLRKLLVPLGISFYTLQAISYVVDVYHGKYRATNLFGKIALFLSFFPQITEGPIANYGRLGDGLYEGHRIERENLLRGALLILWGCFKKIVVADRSAAFVGSVFDGVPGSYGGIYVVMATLLYTLQLYADFSGCIDIARGSARLFGIELSQNFRQPFFANSANEFWRRWHISLTDWFREYVFYPVSLSKPFMNFSCHAQKSLGTFAGRLAPAAAALFVVWLGTGLWHGASWKYVSYGLYYFAIIFAGMLAAPFTGWLFRQFSLSRESRCVRYVQVFRTFVLINIGMMLFRAETVTDFVRLFGAMFQNFSLSPLVDGGMLKLGLDRFDFYVLAAGALLMLAIDVLKEKGCEPEIWIPARGFIGKWSVYAALIFSILIFGAYGSSYVPVDFIYAQF